LRPWQRKALAEKEAKKEEAAAEPVKKEVTSKLQSREIKVPLKVEKTVTPTPILKKPPTATGVDDKKPPSSRSSLSASKSPSTTPSKSPTPAKSSATSSKSTTPSKTPDPTSSDEDSSEEESETETETESDSSDEEEEEIDEEQFDSDLDFSDNEPYRPPSPVNSKQKLIIPALKKVKKAPEPQTNENRSQSPEFAFKKPELKKVITKQKSEVRERTPSPEPKFIKPKLRKVPSSLRTKDPVFKREKLPVVELKKAPSKLMDVGEKKSNVEQFPLKPSALLKNESSKKSELD
jgi:hypothetical protein